MEGKPLGLLEFLEKLGLTALWTFVGLFFNEENGHVELRFSCPRSRSHHCTECELTHDFRDLLRRHPRTLPLRSNLRAFSPQ